MSYTPELLPFDVIPVILCGGVGKRLFPLSTDAAPKQFHTLLENDASMLVNTCTRFATAGFSAPMILTQQRYTALVEEQCATLPEITIIAEQGAYGNALAVAYAALHASPDDLLLVTPADHGIRDIASFQRTIRHAARTLKKDMIAIFSIPPTHASPDYGYIKRRDTTESAGAYHVAHFCEKPDALTAISYVKDDSYGWNSGMVLCTARTYLNALKQHAPDIFSAAIATYATATINNKSINISAPILPCPALSIDYAILERISNAVTYKLDCGWSDIGSWDALAQWHHCNAHPPKVQRPWGYYNVIYQQHGYKVKRLHILAQQQLSLQSHQHRSEHWLIEAGEVIVRIEDTLHHLRCGDDIIIPQGSIHRAKNITSAPLIILEVQRGDILCENDITRY